MPTVTPSYTFLETVLFGWPRKVNKRTLSKVLAEKTVVITGASYGIGEQLAYILAPTGARLILIGRTTDKLETVASHANHLGAKAHIWTADLRDEAQIAALIAYLQTLSVDILVNNAGKSIRRPFLQSLDRLHDFERTMAINYHAPVRLSLALMPTLLQRKGHLINISTANAQIAPTPYWAAYQASKMAFDQWFRCAAPELRAKGVACSTFYLPLVKTRMIEPTAAYTHAPAMKPEHVANLIARYIISRKRVYKSWWLIFPQILSVLISGLWEKAWEKYFVKQKI